MRIALGLPDPILDRAAEHLEGKMPHSLIVPLREVGDDGVLLVAPHEYEPDILGKMLRSNNWSWVHLTSAGVDFVDLATWPAATLLTRSWQCYAAPLTEYVIAAMISHEWGKHSPWSSPTHPRGGLWGATVGIAGWGAVGQRVAKVAAALGASVEVLSRTPRVRSGLISHTTELDDLLDVEHLVIALPLTSETRSIFDRRFLDAARPGMHLVNVSRAEIVDQAHLGALCSAGRLNATLDVAQPEPLPLDHPLRNLPSVRYSPHTAWSSRESQYAFIEDFLAVAAVLEHGSRDIPGRVGQTGSEQRLARLKSQATQKAGR